MKKMLDENIKMFELIKYLVQVGRCDRFELFRRSGVARCRLEPWLLFYCCFELLFDDIYCRCGNFSISLLFD